MSVPQPWTPESVATPEDMVAALHATDEGGADLVQLLTPEGERVPDERFDSYAADIGVAGAAGPLPRHGAGAPLRPGGQRPAAAGPARHLGAAARARRPRRSGPGARSRRRTWRSPPTASTAWRGAAGSTPPSCSGSSGAPTRAAGTPGPPASTSTRSSSATSASTPPATRWARSSSPRWATGADAEATMCFFGDGATSQGDVHEGFVWAAVYDAPVVFYCQNNQWAISEPTERQTRVPLYKRAQGYGFPGIRVDGNDVLACLAVSRWALEECRTGNGPVLVEAFTYRMDAHTTSDDPTRYRLADELELWKLQGPDRTGAGAPRPVARRRAGVLRRGRGRGRRARRAVPAVLHGRCPRPRRSGSSPRSTRRSRRWWPRSARPSSAYHASFERGVTWPTADAWRRR